MVSLDVGDGVVDLEGLGNRCTALGAEFVVFKAAKRGGSAMCQHFLCYRPVTGNVRQREQKIWAGQKRVKAKLAASRLT